MSFIKKNFICKEKFGTVEKVKVKLVTKIKKPSQPAITCSKLTIETLEQGVKYVQS